MSKRIKKVSINTNVKQHREVIAQAKAKGLSVSNYLLEELFKPIKQIEVIEKIQNQLSLLSADDKEITDLLRNLILYDISPKRHKPELIKRFEKLRIELKDFYNYTLKKRI